MPLDLHLEPRPPRALATGTACCALHPYSPISHAASGTPALIAHGHATLDYALLGERAPSQITLYRSGVTKDLGVTGPYEVEEPAPTLSHESALAC